MKHSVYSAGRPSLWALAHILVSYMFTCWHSWSHLFKKTQTLLSGHNFKCCCIICIPYCMYCEIIISLQYHFDICCHKHNRTTENIHVILLLFCMAHQLCQTTALLFVLTFTWPWRPQDACVYWWHLALDLMVTNTWRMVPSGTASFQMSLPSCHIVTYILCSPFFPSCLSSDMLFRTSRQDSPSCDVETQGLLQCVFMDLPSTVLLYNATLSWLY